MQQKEKRRWIYAKKPAGRLYTYRQWVGYTLLLFLFAAPFVKIEGNPLLMFNIIERKFSFFGSLFYPQDLHLLVFAMLILMVGIVLFTAVFGRIWCGWACPQTIFMELVFRRIEYLIEGDWRQQQRLDKGGSSDLRAWKKLLKHGVFFLISLLISNIFLAYIIGSDALISIIRDPIEKHITGFVSIMLFATVFYAVYAYVREIVCTTVCPYGRLQSVLLDDQSITVAYDARRGEPRSKKSKKSREDADRRGDCIDCRLCVHVCPTGIDIREGVQMECISCTACIDACDAVMEKMGRPKRLIGFYTMGEIMRQAGVKAGNLRIYAYSGVLLVLMVVFGVLIFNRTAIDARLLRATGTSYQIRDDGTVSNLYTLELVNKAGRELSFEVKSAETGMHVQLVNAIQKLQKDGTARLSLFLIMQHRNIVDYKQHVVVEIVAEGEVVNLETTFIAPPYIR